MIYSIKIMKIKEEIATNKFYHCRNVSGQAGYFIANFIVTVLLK